MGSGQKSLFAASGLHDQDGHHAHIYGENLLKIFSSGTNRPMALGLGVQHLGHGPNKV